MSPETAAGESVEGVCRIQEPGSGCLVCQPGEPGKFVLFYEPSVSSLPSVRAGINDLSSHLLSVFCFLTMWLVGF